MTLQLWYDSTQQPFESDPANEDWGDARALWDKLKASGKAQCQEMDTSTLSDEEREEGYWKAVVPTQRYACRGYAIRQVFGSQRKGAGPHFGRGVPALLVYKAEGKYPTDVYPHRERTGVFTIYSYLKDLLSELGVVD